MSDDSDSYALSSGSAVIVKPTITDKLQVAEEIKLGLKLIERKTFSKNYVQMYEHVLLVVDEAERCFPGITGRMPKLWDLNQVKGFGISYLDEMKEQIHNSLMYLDMMITFKIGVPYAEDFLIKSLNEAKSSNIEGFPRCAAIMDRVVIEQVLRLLCDRYRIPCEDIKMAGQLLQELYGHDAISKPRMNTIQSKIAIANEAIHSEKEPSPTTVESLIDWTEEFVYSSLAGRDFPL